MRKEVIKDKLDIIFKKQELLQRRLKNIPFKNHKHKQEFINITILACLDELSEILRETTWKNPKYIAGGWKNTQKFKLKEFREEIIDLWHFLINLSISAGLSSNDLFDEFLNKNEKNHERQDKGY
jgi:dimeric dUTPase (all-alpha-NTP-PPase superfamily)